MEIIVVIFIIGFSILMIYAMGSDRRGNRKQKVKPPSPAKANTQNAFKEKNKQHDIDTKHQGPERQRPINSNVEHDPPPPIPVSHRLKGRAWVIDGDTIAIKKIKIRLAGIDAPELDQPWGQKSKWAMVKICKGQIIRCELTGETSYDRLIGTCYLDDGTDIGAELIKQGLALDGGHFSKGKYRHLEPDGVRKRLRFYGRWR